MSGKNKYCHFADEETIDHGLSSPDVPVIKPKRTLAALKNIFHKTCVRLAASLAKYLTMSELASTKSGTA